MNRHKLTDRFCFMLMNENEEDLSYMARALKDHYDIAGVIFVLIQKTMRI